MIVVSVLNMYRLFFPFGHYSLNHTSIATIYNSIYILLGIEINVKMIHIGYMQILHHFHIRDTSIYRFWYL